MLLQLGFEPCHTSLEIQSSIYPRLMIQLPCAQIASKTAKIRISWLITEHDYMGEHLYRIGVYDYPYCRLRGLKEPMNRKHMQYCSRDSAECNIE
ncbi:hypothetical protein CEXT_546391 [Caerostris extrusa]|uniref:Uncharacterized protein n=1 Tax=Caerostris extrusa TaxID=172846 RepID=A0AAV4XN04_CAEEX|nr:hypothetical protein CEXT_546391 [Caerostris extrusa]